MIRFDENCKYGVVAPSSVASVNCRSITSFYGNWVASFTDFIQIHGNIWLPITLPLSFIYGILCVVLKSFLLNPPFLSQSKFRFEVDTVFPGVAPSDRLAFAKSWYSKAPRDLKFHRVRSRFTHLKERNIWMEQCAIYPYLHLPVMCGSVVFDEVNQQWHFNIYKWHPHAYQGWVILGENPKGTGWLIAGEIDCWGPLRPLYKFLIVRVIGWYAEEIDLVMKTV